MKRITNWLHAFFQRRIVEKRKADFIIGGEDNPYLIRWWITPWTRLYRDFPADKKWTLWHEFWTRLPGAFLHLFLRSDDDRALHDHPWASISILLSGEYTEHEILPGGVHKKTVLKAGDIRIRWTGKFAHRIELHDGPCWTLFLTGPRYRHWGFHCTAGWRHWKQFVSTKDKGQIGQGCE